METQEEYGGFDNVQFLRPEYAIIYTADDKPMLCKCGNVAGSMVIGKEAYIAFCAECSLWNEIDYG